MQTSTEIIRDYINKNCMEWNCENLQEKNSYGYTLDNKCVDMAVVNGNEEIVISYADISITGTERAKPQIRVFMDKQKSIYEFARLKKKRFFLFTIFSKDLAMAKNISNFDPHDFIVSIETNVDNETSRRDLRSLYDYLDNYIGQNGDVDYLRCTQGQHQSGIYQASFIRIRKNGEDTPDTMKEYIKYFDNRPYMDSVDNSLTVDEGKTIEFSYNRIIFGAPGTGKSHTLEEDSKQFGDNMERVTFHPNYSYANFVGTYKPVMAQNELDWLIDDDKKKVISVLQDKSMTAQEKYDLLYDKFKDKDLTRLPLLLGIYTDESFKTKKIDGTDAAGDNGVERNHGKAIRPYLNLQSLKRNNEISYEYVPGPFMRIYVQAINHPEEDFLLLIEEINRANVAAVFGDVFQLLDRKNGISEYPIATSEDMKKYLMDNIDILKGKNINELSNEEKEMYLELRIPNNMYIWATMNSADQGVFPMDTAFKRRWEFEYIGIDKEREKVLNYIIPIGMGDNRYYIHWNDLREGINSVLSKDENRVNEDKLLGPFFISKSVLDNMSKSLGDSKAEDAFIKAFESKVIMYLFEDVMKMRPEKIFIGCKEKKLFSKICEAFETDGEKIFGLDNIKPVQIEPTSYDTQE